MRRSAVGALPAVAAALAAACAQPGSPPGGAVDRTPPRVVQTTPAAFDTLTDLERPALIVFDERLSIRYQDVTELAQAVLVSPADGVPIVDRGRRRVTVRMAGGWQPDRVYTVTLLPVYSDLFGNRRDTPVELVFSTGAPIPDAAVAGFVTDRLTGSVVEGARVEAVRRIDGSRYVAVTDTAGFFGMRYMPAGAYDVIAWNDQDRDREVDFFEVQDTAELVFGVADTAFTELAVLPMDTTPARLARAEFIDSAKVRLVFDDHFAPGPVVGSARLRGSPDSTLITGDGRLVHSTRLDSILAAEAAIREAIRAEQARRDSIQAADTARPPPDVRDAPPEAPARTPAPRAGASDSAADRAPVRAPGAAQPQAGRQQGRDRDPLPSRELVLLLPGTLEPDTTYWVEVVDVVNIRGVPGGGGWAPLRTPEPPPDTAVADTAATDAVPGDSPAAPDTIPTDTVRPDTIPPDTIPPDTIPPDTVPAAHPTRSLQ